MIRAKRYKRLGEMATKMILTGDVNLINVTDPTVPFALVRDEFRGTPIEIGRAHV